MRSISLVFTLIVIFVWSPAKGQQTILPDSPSVSVVTAENSTIKLRYNNTESGVNALSVKVFFDGRYLSVGEGNFFPSGFLGSTIAVDEQDLDDNPATTHYLMMSWVDLQLNKQWPVEQSDLVLAQFSIQAEQDLPAAENDVFAVSAMTILRDEVHSDTQSAFASHFLYVNQGNSGSALLDFAGNGQPAVVNYDIANKQYKLASLDGAANITISGEYSNVKVYLLDDIDGNGTPEYGLLGIRSSQGNEDRIQLKVVDAESGNNVGTYNWVANWSQVKLVSLPDLTGDGFKEIAIQGHFKEGNRPQLVVRDGASGSSYQTFSFPDLWNNPQYMAFTDVTGDGVAEIALFGLIKRNNKPQVKVVDGANRAKKLSAYTFPDKWDDVSWHRLGDVNADGKDDWGMYGVRRADQSPQLIVKNGVSPKGALAIYSWPDDMINPALTRVTDTNQDSTAEFATGGYRLGANRYQFIIKNGQDRSETLMSLGWPANWEEVAFINIGDFTGNGYDDIALLGVHTNTNTYQLSIRNGGNKDAGVTSAIIENWDLGSDWQQRPKIYAASSSEVVTLIAYGFNKAGEVVSVKHTYSE